MADIDYADLATYHNPSEPLPRWLKEIRPTQATAIAEIMDAYHGGADVVFLDAPVGAGKTLIAELVRRARGGRGVYTCSDKALQRQFSRDFPYAQMLMGKANYGTEHGPNAITAEDCTSMVPGDACNWCDHRSTCPYNVAKIAAIQAPLAVLNVSYLLASANYAGAFNKEGFTVVDEADTLENALLGFVEYKVPQWAMRSLSVRLPKKGSHKATLVKSLEEMANASAVELRRMIARNAEPKAIRQMQSFGISTSVMQMALAKDIAAGDDSEESGHWLRVYDDGDDTFQMKPVLVGSFGTQALWRHAKQWLLMSGTLVSVDEMVDTLGLPLDHATVTVPMAFPVENRPIIIAPIADMSYKAGENEYEQMAFAIHRVLVNHPGERVLIHTVSRARAERLMATLHTNDWTEGRRLIDYRSARERDQALDRYKRTEGAVMFAQSMVRGVDLPGDLCRVQIIAKVPFASLGDKRVSARLHLPGGDAWYKVQAIRDVVQMTGRGVRSDTDHATTYIFDRQFTSNLWHPTTRRMFPAYWRDAVDNSRDVREFMLGAQVAAR